MTQPVRRGFGMPLLDKMLAYDLDVRTTLAHRSEGLRYGLRIPLTPQIGRLVGPGTVGEDAGSALSLRSARDPAPTVRTALFAEAGMAETAGDPRQVLGRILAAVVDVSSSTAARVIDRQAKIAQDAAKYISTSQPFLWTVPAAGDHNSGSAPTVVVPRVSLP